ncbi:hypothetical protein SAMN05421748_106221 [Paractinoplanes atraurantiacus]|uniref:Uncharacterized protein n=1 Tax=Paractinoplanes atraurantiacus TaxID=1036182 RepID=A0A285I4B9_9ACTN|nr:hypothetical protein SAMN05421748_106221 [Actinoplanes atraurantiacus]
MEPRAITREDIKRAVSESTRASARLEGREVPEGFVRSARVEEFLKNRSKAA